MLNSLSTQKSVLYLINKYSSILSRIEVEILLSFIFKCPRENLYINDISIDRAIEELLDSLIKRRLSGEPLQYITGTAEFMGLDFIVNKDVFMPRPETELLVDAVLPSAFSLQPSASQRLSILDLCTGCGDIAISLACLLPHVKIIATDVSEKVLKVAQKNAVLHQVAGSIAFYKGDLFRALPFDKRYKFDIIISNPPYVKDSEIEFLQKEVRYEPKIALDGGKDGLDFYRRIAEEAPDYLKKGGSLFLEIGAGQVEDVKDIFGRNSRFKICNITKDFRGIERVVWINLL